MERCYLCKRGAVLELPYLKKWACDKCILKINYKRFRSQIRGFSNFHLLKEDTPSFHLMKFFFDKTNIKYKVSKEGKIKSTTQDELVESFLNSVIQNKPLEKKKILPLSLTPQNEIGVINKSLGLPYKFKKESFLLKSLDEVEKRRPGVKFSIRKVIDDLQKL